MVSALALEPVQEWVLETPALDSAELLARQALESDAARMAVARNRRIVAYCDHVYPFLAVRVVPPRGPDA